jgi:hypothetical protein
MHDKIIVYRHLFFLYRIEESVCRKEHTLTGPSWLLVTALMPWLVVLVMSTTGIPN